MRQYALHDLIQTDEGDWVSSCVLDAVRADGADVLAHPETHAGAAKAVAAGVATEFLWAARGLQNEAQGLYDEGRIAALGLPADIRVTPIRGRQPLHGGLRPGRDRGGRRRHRAPARRAAGGVSGA